MASEVVSDRREEMYRECWKSNIMDCTCSVMLMIAFWIDNVPLDSRIRYNLSIGS